MNEYRWNDIFVSLEHEFSMSVTEEHMDMFKIISHDINPLHIDSNYAISKGFDNRVVYGMLTASFYSTLVGVYLPGKYCLFHSIDIKFTKPVYCPCVLSVYGKVINKDDLFKQITITSKIMSAGSIVSKAIIKAGVLE